MQNLQKDRVFIENKYHKTDEDFNPHRRMQYHGWECDPATGLSDDELREGLRELAKETSGLPHPVAKARAIAYVLAHVRIDVNEHDWFILLYSLNRLIRETTQNVWANEVFTDILPETDRAMREFSASGALAIWPDYDHVIPTWDAILSLGFPGLRQRARDYRAMHEEKGDMTAEMAAFFDGIEIEYTAIVEFIGRVAAYAHTLNHEKAQGIARCMEHLQAGAPTNFYEALQQMYLYFIISESIDTYQVRSLGNGLDSTLRGFFETDLKNGTYTREEMGELLGYFFLQWSAIGNYWGQPFYMAGTNPDGTSRVNDLSYLILETYDALDIYNPKIQIKVAENTPTKFLYRVFDMIRRGHSSFVFCCEPGYISALMSYGATLEEARDFDIRGCYESGVRENEVSAVTGYVNGLKAVEFVFSDGFDHVTGKQIGLHTGAVEDLETFEDFYTAVLAQWSHIIESSLAMSDAYEKYMGYVNPSSLYSATMLHALEKGADGYQCGVKFNNSSLLNCSFASLVDAVMAVKEFVYDRKEVTMTVLKAALDADWEGYADLRVKVLTSPHKYGNGDAETDLYARAMAQFFANKVNNRPNARGGVYKANMHSALQFVRQGKLTRATPDGRRAGEETSKNGSPTPGMDRNGVTALLKSVGKLEPCQYPEAFCLDLMLHPSAVEGEEGLAIMKSLIDVYMKNGGMAIQMNVFRVETLYDAQVHPENYQNLQVRVCGWNVLWVNLSRQEQDAYIRRCEKIR